MFWLAWQLLGVLIAVLAIGLVIGGIGSIGRIVNAVLESERPPKRVPSKPLISSSGWIAIFVAIPGTVLTVISRPLLD